MFFLHIKWIHLNKSNHTFMLIYMKVYNQWHFLHFINNNDMLYYFYTHIHKQPCSWGLCRSERATQQNYKQYCKVFNAFYNLSNIIKVCAWNFTQLSTFLMYWYTYLQWWKDLQKDSCFFNELTVFLLHKN